MSSIQEDAANLIDELQRQLAASEASRKELVEVLKWAKAQIEGLARRSFVGPKEAQEWIDNCQALKAANKALANAAMRVTHPIIEEAQFLLTEIKKGQQ